MSIDKRIDSLKRIKAVDAPPYLLTRINQQISNISNIEAPVNMKWAFALTFAFVMAVNVSILFNSTTVSKNKSAGVENIVNAMNLSAQNDLYNE
jgi:hypothetical protein